MRMRWARKQERMGVEGRIGEEEAKRCEKRWRILIKT